MAYEIPGFSFPLPAAANYSVAATSGQFRLVKNTGGKAETTAAGQHAIGMRQNTPRLNEATTIVGSGIVFGECGAAVANGDLLASDSVGRVVKAVAGDYIIGEALETGSAAGILIAVLLHNSAAKA